MPNNIPVQTFSKIVVVVVILTKARNNVASLKDNKLTDEGELMNPALR